MRPLHLDIPLQDFFATENMAYADAVNAGVGIDPESRAYHMFIKSGFIDDQIFHIYGFVYDPETVGPGAALWIFERFRKLCSGSTTTPGTWTDTVTPERPWAGTHDL